MCSRRVIVLGSAAAAAAALPGCAGVALPAPDELGAGNPATPLTVDVHAHVFNGTDIQVERFVTLVRGRKQPELLALGEVLQQVVWSVAPTAEDELGALAELSAVSRDQGFRGATAVRERHRIDREVAGARELNRALDRYLARRAGPGIRKRRGEDEVVEAIRRLASPGGLKRVRTIRSQDSAVEAAIRFALRQFQYRYVNALEFVKLYDAGSTRKIDLALCHMIDFDWALAKGTGTPSSIARQVAVMERIAIVTGGRIHGFVPFCPYRQVAHGLGLTPDDPLADVRNAITAHGHIGVKMYLPMGFAPYGNDDKPASFWNRTWMDPRLLVPDLGSRLDAALGALYAWCAANGVPIMAHTSPSNGPVDDFEHCTKPEGWRRVPVGGLRVNFGHFGDTELGIREPKLTREYTGLMGPAGSSGSHFYADSAYFSDAVHGSKGLAPALLGLFRETRDKREANLAHRLMYGSDWSMLLIEPGNTGAYLRTFEAMFRRFDGDGSLGASGRLSDAFFGRNAVGYLGLRAGEPARARLDAFYAANGVPKPLWADKVDRMGEAA